MEVRYGGVDIFADPGTYCYHSEPTWRSYFRSTVAHNMAELAAQNQSAESGPFLWLRHAAARETEVRDDGDTVVWAAEHDGYLSLDPPARHRRTARLDQATRTIEIVDEIDASHDIRLAFHLGPGVHVDAEETCAILSWRNAAGPGTARLELVKDAPAAGLLAASEPGVRPVRAQDTHLVVAVPGPDKVVPAGPRHRGSIPGHSAPPRELVAACASADLVLTLAALDPSLGGINWPRGRTMPS